ncbi:nuclear transport factor 2 family protein [Pseudomonadota bacterium]|jgi:ketosteroid isomerase-like protein
MSERSDIEQAVSLFFEAINQNNAAIVPLTDDVVMCGPMMPEQMTGEAAVRQYITDIAPFISRAIPETTIIEGDSAAVIVSFEMLNGVTVQGAEFFRVRDGQIWHDRVFFDTRVLFKGGN